MSNIKHCLFCKHHRNLPRVAHVACSNPAMYGGRGAAMLEVISTSVHERENFIVHFSPDSVKKGDVCFPMHYDPFSVVHCTGHEPYTGLAGWLRYLKSDVERQIL